MDPIAAQESPIVVEFKRLFGDRTSSLQEILSHASRLNKLPVGPRRVQRAHGKAPRNWGKNVTLISSISAGGVGPSMSIEGSSDKEFFSLYLRELLCQRSRRDRS